jgi:hypothetical protein
MIFETDSVWLRLSGQPEVTDMRNILLLGIAGAFTVAMATWMAATVLIVLPRKVAATPVFAEQTGLPCGQCHENPAGGGKLKEFGQKFQANGNKLPDK